MAKNDYTVNEVVRTLNKVQGINVSGNTIRTIENLVIGIKVWGKIDFLKKNGFTHVISKTIKNFKADKGDKENIEERRRKKKKNGIDALSGVKAIMKPSNFKLKK